MSKFTKLDDVWFDLPVAETVDFDDHREFNKRIKELFLELIGEDLPVPSGPRGAGKTYAAVSNRVRAELRDKVNEL